LFFNGGFFLGTLKYFEKNVYNKLRGGEGGKGFIQGGVGGQSFEPPLNDGSGSGGFGGCGGAGWGGGVVDGIPEEVVEN